MVKSSLIRIYNQFTQLDSSKLSLMVYDPKWNHFTYIQDNRTIVITSLANFVIPTNNLRYAVLTPNGYSDMMTKLSALIGDDKLTDETSLLVPKVLGLDVFQSKTSRLFMFPIRISSLKIADITNKLVINILYRVIYKKFNNPLLAYKASLSRKKNY